MASRFDLFKHLRVEPFAHALQLFHIRRVLCRGAGDALVAVFLADEEAESAARELSVLRGLEPPVRHLDLALHHRRLEGGEMDERGR